MPEQIYDYLIAPKASFDATADAIRARRASQSSITWGQDGFADAIADVGWNADDVGSLTYPFGLDIVYTKTTIGAAAFLGTNITSFYAPNCTSVSLTKSGGALQSSTTSALFSKCTSLTSINMPVLTATQDWLANGCTSLTSVNIPLATYVGSRSFDGCTSLPGYVGKAVYIVYTYGFYGCTNLVYLDILGGNTATGFRHNSMNGCSKLNKLVIRSTAAVQKLENINSFTNTPFASGKAGGTLYVPNALIASYQSATNWSTILGYETNSIKSIESTHTDPNAPIDLTLYYADGTLIPTT